MRRVNQVSCTPILNHAWPADLDPETVSFATRTETVLRRHGLYDDPARFGTLTVAEVAGWTNTGPVTIANLRTIGHAAIRRYHAETDLRARIELEFECVAAERWATRIWHQDPRFREHLPRGDQTVYDIATAGTAADRQLLFDRLDDLRAAIDAQAAVSLDDAVAQYVELITGQHGIRLEVLLARTGLGGHEPIAAPVAGQRLGVTYQRIHQLVQQFERHRNRAAAPAGVWMPQIDTAVEHGWPDGYTEAGIAAITQFVSPQ